MTNNTISEWSEQSFKLQKRRERLVWVYGTWWFGVPLAPRTSHQLRLPPHLPGLDGLRHEERSKAQRHCLRLCLEHEKFNVGYGSKENITAIRFEHPAGCE